MITANIDLTGLNRGIAGLIRATGLESKIVVAKEMGELEKTLVRLSPKAKPANITRDISRKFETVGDEGNSNMDRHGKVGASGIDWYRVDSEFLRGVAPKDDKRGASVDELKALSYRITKKGRLNLPFRNRKGSQRVLLYQSIVTKRSTVNKLIAAKKKNRGRLAAAWLAPVFKGIIRLTGANLPPGFVTDHANGVRGDYINGLDIPKNPTFTVMNFAKGVGKPAVVSMMRTAVAIRIKAMQANALMFMRGKKRVSDYAR